MKKIIDISFANTVNDWNSVKKNVDGVIIRIGYRGYGAGNIKTDTKFIQNAKSAALWGVPTGYYFMSQAINEAESEEEADYCYKQVKEKKVSLPVFYDSELSNQKGNGRADKLTKSQRTATCKAFCNRIIAHGLKAGVYASTSWYRSFLNASELADYYIWVAQYNNKCTADHRIDLWQYTSKGSVPGILGNVDISECYVDFSEKKKAEEKDLYWLSAADVWTREEAEKARELFEKKYPGIPLGLRRAKLSSVKTID